MSEQPVLAETIPAVREAVARTRARGLSIGLVPTLGALHEGHLSLIHAARRDCDFVVVSIFVNPTQFGPSEDFREYPRQLDQDLKRCGDEGVDLVFAPSEQEMYPKGFCTIVEVQGLQRHLCGPFRPGHFRGVATVVLKLFNIVTPDVAYFGQKDAQQARIVRQLVRDVDLTLRIEVCSTVRERDGLALSSRNQYLSAAQRQRALCLCRALQAARRMVEGGERDADRVRQTMRQIVESEGLAELDYAALVDPDTLEEVRQIDRPVLAAVAARIDKARLIDNLMIVPF